MSDVTAGYGMHLDFIMFFLGIFIHYWLQFISEELCLQKLLQIVYLINKWYADTPDVTTSYGRISGLIGSFGNFNVW